MPTRRYGMDEYITVSADDIDIRRLRSDLMDHYGTATGCFPMAYMDVAKVEDASAQELVDMAEKEGFDIRKYLHRW